MRKLFCIIGYSGSGKTTLVNLLKKEGYTSIDSYTTRPKRSEAEVGHTFVLDKDYEDFKEKGQIFGYDNYNGYHYFATIEQALTHDLYVVTDVLEESRKVIKDKNLPLELISIFLYANEEERIRRMQLRGDSEEHIAQRIMADRNLNRSGIKKYGHYIENNDLENALADIKEIIRLERMI